MEVSKQTLSNVFAGERRYVIPLFQRPYVWTREQQWEPLWEDFVERAELELASDSRANGVHFLGAVVVQQRPSVGDEILAYDVIDGQQRLTTFQLMFSAMRDLAAAMAEKQMQAWLEGLTQNRAVIAHPEVERYKVWPTARDVELYQVVTDAGSLAAIEAQHPRVHRRRKLVARPRMVEAYIYFYESLAAWLTQAGPEHSPSRFRALRRVLDKQFQLVSIHLSGDEDPQAIFETLNARGVPLLASDLLRNYIFQRAGVAQAETLHKKYWVQFEEPDDPARPDSPRFWEVEERQGRLLRARLDLLVQHYLAMRLGHDVHSTRLFLEYKTWIETKRPFDSVEQELRSFAEFATHFKQLLRPSGAGPIARFAQRLRALDTSTVYPLVLGLIGNRRLSDTDRNGIYTDLESFLVRRTVCARPTNNYNRFFLQILRDFDATAEPTRAAFQSLLSRGTEDTDWPSDADFREAWSTLDAYTFFKPARVEMMLRALDDAMADSRAESRTIHSALTVEHVLPQSWQAHWPLSSGSPDDPEQLTQIREDHLHDFGNLTLLTQPMNSTVSNGPADTKLAAIAGSLLNMNRYFQGRRSWTEADIAKRSSALFEVALQVWPRP